MQHRSKHIIAMDMQLYAIVIATTFNSQRNKHSSMLKACYYTYIHSQLLGIATLKLCNSYSQPASQPLNLLVMKFVTLQNYITTALIVMSVVGCGHIGDSKRDFQGDFLVQSMCTTSVPHIITSIQLYFMHITFCMLCNCKISSV